MKHIYFYTALLLPTIAQADASWTFKTKNPSVTYPAPHELTAREALLVQHAQTCIADIENGYRAASPSVDWDAMSAFKVRSLLNRLCSLPKTSYLEIGLWSGSTFISALHENDNNVVSAIGIDNWTQQGGPRAQFEQNCERYLPKPRYTYDIYNQDSFTVDKAAFKRPVTMYFYDGSHEEIDQERAFTYFNDVLDDVFITIVDDFRFAKVRNGTFNAFAKLGYTILFERSIPAVLPDRECEWWNGIYIAVIRKNK